MLRVLDLRGAEISSGGAQILADAQSFARLRHLDLAENPIGPGGLAALAGSPYLRGLRALNLSQLNSARGPIVGRDVSAFLGKLDMPELRHLNLDLLPVGVRGAKHIASRPTFANLTRLGLSACAVGRAGAKAIVRSKTLANLVTLDVSANRVGSGASTLASRKVLPTTRVLPARDRRPAIDRCAPSTPAGSARLMTERDALYRAIIANPEDDTPRFVYADWLEENGRAEEAEFIRVECRLETLAPEDPEFTDLLARQEELRLWLTVHVAGPEVKLSSGLHVAAGAEWWKATQRGFPRFLEIEGLFDPSPRAMRSLAAALAKAFARLPTRWLVLRYISCAQLAELLRHPELVVLDRLTIHLSASEDPQDEAACRLIAGSAHLRKLRSLVLAFPVDDAGASELASSPHLTELRALTLDQCMPCTAAAIRALDASEWFHRLNLLDLRGLDDAAFEELCRLEPLPNLHTLELDESSFPISSSRTFARSTTFPRIDELSKWHRYVRRPNSGHWPARPA